MGYSSKQEEEVGILLSPLNEKEESEKNGSEIPRLAFPASVAGCGRVGVQRGRERAVLGWFSLLPQTLGWS